MAPVAKQKKSEEVAKKRGRPKGSTKSEKIPKVAKGEQKKKRGRPKGSQNKVSVKTKKVEKKAKPTDGQKKQGRPKTKVDAEYPTKFIDLVLQAMKALDNKKGSSLQAVKKYMEVNNGIDPKKKSIFINKSIRKLTEDGILRHRAGTGANGSFKLIKKD